MTLKVTICVIHIVEPLYPMADAARSVIGRFGTFRRYRIILFIDGTCGARCGLSIQGQLRALWRRLCAGKKMSDALRLCTPSSTHAGFYWEPHLAVLLLGFGSKNESCRKRNIWRTVRTCCQEHEPFTLGV